MEAKEGFTTAISFPERGIISTDFKGVPGVILLE